METNYFIYGDKKIKYNTSKNSNLIDKIRIKINNSMILVEHPVDKNLEEVQNAIYNKSRWIYKKLNKQSKNIISDTQVIYKSGMTILYLGRRYKLILKEDVSKKKLVILDKGCLVVYNSLNNNDTDKLINNWYLEKSSHIFNKKLKIFIKILNWVDENQGYSLRRMTKQWGSCSPSGRIILNKNLIKAPSLCIDYVILHELCHLQEHNHSKKFYELLNTYMPTWKKHKEKLDALSDSLLT